MRDLSSLLARVKAALGSDTALREAVRSSVEECIHAQLSDSEFSIKNGVLTLSSGPLLKSEFRLKEADILLSIQKKIGPNKITKVLYY